MYGYGGKVLRVDLTDRTVHSHPTEEHLTRAFLGGRGLNVKRLWDELPAHTDGLSPDNILVFGVGPLVGTTFPGGARFNAVLLKMISKKKRRSCSAAEAKALAEPVRGLA